MYISHLKSPERPDAVLQFLRDAGVTQPHVRAAALRGALFLGYSVDKCFKPRMAALLQLGFSPSHISLLLSLCPEAFAYVTLSQKIQFWMQIMGSVDNFLPVLKKARFLLTVNLQNSAMPNLSFLRDQCGFSDRQIVRLTKEAPRAITSSPAALKIKAKRAEKLGVRCSSPMFVYALITVCCLNQRTIDARLNNLQSLGLSKEEVITLVSRLPLVLKLPEEVMGRKMEFLMKEVGCDKLQLFSNLCLLTCSLEKRLIPRSLVWKLLKLKGLIGAIPKFASFVISNERRFLQKFVLPYEHALPGLHQAYANACSGNIAGIKWFKSILS